MSISPKLALLEEYALVARALSAPARLMLLEQLAQGERGVEALAAKTGLTIANCSQHLQQLRRAALVTSRREGKAVIYRLTDAKTLQLMDLLRVVAERNLAQVERILRGLSDGEDAPEPITRAELAARLADDSVTVLDVRPADEYAAGHIPGALNATLSEIDGVVSMFDSTAEIVAYCRGPYCVYAHQAVAALRRHGLNARRLDGGLPEWREDGRKIASVS
ncbi:MULTISPECIES: ArsR/SmtB family transcription factor [Roseobacteraceae]|uniref:ArsR family transcriptional regulator n=1 Tax=Marivita cryptomonadis TaxID=505252 RepID=A0A9Q2P0A1_9RHOB|nr:MULTISPECIES: metalloregulator ArsR/SmtB family transcription factor [Roseobacteraceae]MBM2323298.1 ArsR family transcriptional regulator [Marivita cryptomonadis]MBM2332883.1 ArsR family transcriptional regulator [Marivita cryptomonadis]MBM2342464.1 ArsR family transcriptional regulator [Marivita cryptomonadis]MBM2347132.1 ArsR family transcriptional regulator [Marivita cryptomonadis]MBM2351809.1 ArsR family transcriptional regulator [Marivita cryptomonadis]